jgi:mannitol-1-/sugar-/sorbitol-6-phosphatase
MKIEVRALLFDSDGVLVDSNADGDQAWRQWAGEYGIGADAVLDGVHGRRSKDTVSRFLSERERAAGLALIEKIEISGAGATRAIPGANELVRAVPNTRWAVVTSASEALLRARFAGAVLPVPDVVITGDDVQNGKPAPDGYLLAAAKLGVPIASCIVFEDSPAGVAAGRAAGAGHVVGVGERALDTDAQPVVRDLRGIGWDAQALHIPAEALLRSQLS